MKQYLDLCRHVLEHGNERDDRTGTGTLSIFGYQMRFDLSEGFPLVTTKDMMKKRKNGKTRFHDIVEELMWFLRGETNIKTLVDKGVNIWNRDAYRVYKNNGGMLSYKEFVTCIKEDDQFAKEHGELGRIYGKQWREWQSADGTVVDQIKDVIEHIKNNPDSRRLIVTAWNPADIPFMALPPCHTIFQFYVYDGKLSCQLYQRSGDIFLGVPYNIASYALLTTLIARECELEVGEFIYTLGDAHIYLNHVEQIKEQITREPHPLPRIGIRTSFEGGIFDFTADDIAVFDYESHPELTGNVSVGQ